MSKDPLETLNRIAIALERIADSREAMLIDAKDAEVEDRSYYRLTPGEIIDIVSAVTHCDILLKSHMPSFVWARGAAMTAMRSRLGMSLPAIGRALDMNHTTVHHGLARFRVCGAWTKWDHQRWKEIENLLDNRQKDSTIETLKVITNP